MTLYTRGAPWNLPSFPSSPTKLALNVTGVTVCYFHRSTLFTDQPVEQAVLHFREFPLGIDIPDGICWLSQIPDPLCWLTLFTSQTTSVTVVDLDLVPLSALGCENNAFAHPSERQRYLYGELGPWANVFTSRRATTTGPRLTQSNITSRQSRRCGQPEPVRYSGKWKLPRCKDEV